MQEEGWLYRDLNRKNPGSLRQSVTEPPHQILSMDWEERCEIQPEDTRCFANVWAPANSYPAVVVRAVLPIIFFEGKP